MAKGANQKLKMLYLSKIFMEETDDEHQDSAQEIQAGAFQEIQDVFRIHGLLLLSDDSEML